MNRFYESVASVLEVDEVDGSTRFRETADWCSLKAFGLLVLMENDWHAPMTIADLAAVETAGELFLRTFAVFAAEVFGKGSVPLEAEYSVTPGWDSVNHLRLVMEAERRFGMSYPLERIPAMTRLIDFV